MLSNVNITLICAIFNSIWGTYWMLKFKSEKKDDEEFFNNIKERHQRIEEFAQKYYENEDE